MLVRFWNHVYYFRPNCTPLSSNTIINHETNFTISCPVWQRVNVRLHTQEVCYTSYLFIGRNLQPGKDNHRSMQKNFFLIWVVAQPTKRCHAIYSFKSGTCIINLPLSTVIRDREGLFIAWSTGLAPFQRSHLATFCFIKILTCSYESLAWPGYWDLVYEHSNPVTGTTLWTK